MKGASRLLERLLKLKEKYPKDRFIHSYSEYVEKGVANMTAFNNKFAGYLEMENQQEVIKGLNELYSSKEFAQYSDSMIALTVLQQEFERLQIEKPDPYEKIKDAKDAASHPAIFYQRLPRHILLLNELNKLALAEEVSTKYVHQFAADMNTAVNFTGVIGGLDHALKESLFGAKLKGMSKSLEAFKHDKLIPAMFRVYESFSAYANALENHGVFFVSKSDKEYHDLKKQLVHYALRYRTQEELDKYQKYALKIDPKLEVGTVAFNNAVVEALKHASADVRRAVEDAVRFQNYQEKVVRKSKEELLKDQKSLNEYLTGLKMIGEKNVLNDSDAKLYRHGLEELEGFLRLILSSTGGL